MDDDDLPKKPRKIYQPPVLEGWSDADMRDYLAHLESEIARVKARLDVKRGIKAAAEAIFKTGGN